MTLVRVSFLCLHMPYLWGYCGGAGPRLVSGGKEGPWAPAGGLCPMSVPFLLAAAAFPPPGPSISDMVPPAVRTHMPPRLSGQEDPASSGH